MYKMKSNSIFSKFLCITIVIIFTLTSLVIPVYGTTELDGGENTENEQVMPAEEEYFEYEKEADSWRYQEGQNIGEDSAPMMFRLRAAFIPWSKTDEGYVNSRGEIVEGAIKKGIDVSYWQGTIDWNKVKNAGIDFAIIRCGYGMDQKDQDDSQWARNVSECERLGIPYGVYIYSYADSIERAKSEAAHTLRLLKEVKADPDYPVYYDMEDNSTLKNTDNEDLVEFARIFCSTVEAAGYDAGIYANLNWWNNYLNQIPNDSRFDMYDKWVAQYNYRCTYTADEYRLWQCTSSGTVDGIYGLSTSSTEDDYVDINLEFTLEKETNNCKIETVTDEEGNNIFINNGGQVLASQWINYNNNTYYTDENGRPVTEFQIIGSNKYYFNSAGELQKNKWVTVSGKKYYITSGGIVTTGYKKVGNYYYYFDSEGVMKTGTVKDGNKQYSLTSSGIAVIHTAKIKTKLNYRTGPSTKYKKKGTYKKGKVVSVIRTSNGWSQLTNGYWVKSSYTSKVTTYPKNITTVKSYRVKVKTALNYRTGPGTKYKKKGTYKKGKVLTIVSSKNGWGKTSSGYWIKLSYTKKI